MKHNDAQTTTPEQIELNRNSLVNPRFYHAKPEDVSLESCMSHGQNHRGYGWMVQMDPRWSREQMTAYLQGYGLSPDAIEAFFADMEYRGARWLSRQTKSPS